MNQTNTFQIGQSLGQMKVALAGHRAATLLHTVVLSGVAGALAYDITHIQHASQLVDVWKDWAISFPGIAAIGALYQLPRHNAQIGHLTSEISAMERG